jgi:hypothetical protein
MFFLTARLTRRRAILAVLAVGAAAAALILLCGRRSGAEAPPQLLTNADRVAYLRALGWQVEPEPVETLQLLVPEKLPESYLRYNELQKSQGFDLSACCGRQVARYTYTVTNYPGRSDGVQLNLYVCQGTAAAGDVIAAGADGFQSGLAFPGTEGAASAGAP